MKVKKEWGVQFLATYALALDEGKLSASWSADPPSKKELFLDTHLLQGCMQ
jgi:hypothetical protein